MASVLNGEEAISVYETMLHSLNSETHTKHIYAELSNETKMYWRDRDRDRRRRSRIFPDFYFLKCFNGVCVERRRRSSQCTRQW